MRWFRYICWGLGWCCGMAGCCDHTEGDLPSGKTTNEWIYEQMAEHYLYNDYVTGLGTVDYSLSNADFFTSLLSARAEDNDGKHPNRFGKDYFYSYLETLDLTRTVGSNVFSYGIEYELYAFDDGSNLLRVLYVAQGSVAEQAGVVRGDWIAAIDGEPVTEGNYLKISNGGAISVSIGQRDYDGSGQWNWCEGSPRTLDLPAASRITNSPVYKVAGPDKLGLPGVAYLVYHEFNTGPGGFSDKTFDEELKTAFRSFQTQNVRELILDLRYNAGGYTECCRLLSSLIVPSQYLGQVFAVHKYNAQRQAAQENPQTQYFLEADELSDPHVELSRLWVIVGSHTASSSELLINALRPYMEVILVGSPTEGKNVGTYQIASAQYGLTLYPITFQSYNCLDESDYQNGFTPQYVLDELFASEAAYRPMKELGDPAELLLGEVLAQMGYGEGSDLGETRRGGLFRGTMPRVVKHRSSLEQKPIRGMILASPGETPIL